MLPVGKGTLVDAAFHPQLGSIRTTLGLDHSLPGHKESTELVLDFLPPLGISVPVLTQCMLPCPASACASHTSGQPHCYVCLPLHHKRDAHRPSPCRGHQEGLAGHEEPTPTIEADLALFLLFVYKVFHHQKVIG